MDMAEAIKDMIADELADRKLKIPDNMKEFFEKLPQDCVDCIEGYQEYASYGTPSQIGYGKPVDEKDVEIEKLNQIIDKLQIASKMYHENGCIYKTTEDWRGMIIDTTKVM